MQIYRDSDVDAGILDGKKIALLGYGSQGRAQALCLRDSGFDVVVGVRKGKSWEKAKEDGFKTVPVAEAVEGADIVMMMLPDEAQPDIYASEIGPHLKKGCALEFAHGFAITYGLITPPKDVDVIMVAPKGPGEMERLLFLDGFGVPALFCIHQDSTGHAKELCLALAKGLGTTRAGVFESSFRSETHCDLFGEQAVLCGGVTAMIEAGFKTLVDAGYPPEMAYFEVLHETKLVTDLINARGIDGMWRGVSNTAEFGGLTRRSRVITSESVEGMRSILDDIESGRFKDEWRAEWHNGLKNLRRMEDEEADLQVEVIGKEIRALFKRK